MPEETRTELNRRNFLAAAAVTCGCALTCPFALGADDDDDGDDDVPKVAMGPVDIGLAGDFAKDGSYDKWIKERHMIVFRENGKLYATTAICTHKQALLKIMDNQIYCPRHKSRFTFEGQPAPKPTTGRIGLAKKPLSRFTITIDARKHVIVDTSKPIGAEKADDPKAFIKL
ncbi:MAG TPA: Rieske (2Fe-2S) protein [Humisphaera sp.]|nr:Rieske (2Fe-2S) protein [Humisphaera sp.]